MLSCKLIVQSNRRVEAKKAVVKCKRKRQREVWSTSDIAEYELLSCTLSSQELSEGELEELAKEARLLKKFKAGKV